jgi:hypothetical protein
MQIPNRRLLIFSTPSTVSRGKNNLTILRSRPALVRSMNLIDTQGGSLYSPRIHWGDLNVAGLGVTGGGRNSHQIEGSWHWTFAFGALLPVRP